MDGPGTDTVQLSDYEGHVCLHFERPVSFVKLDPPTASSLAEAMARAAYKCISGDVPTTMAKSQITEQMRIRLKNRVAIMIRSMENDTPSPSYEVRAHRIVDELLKEAT